jgi:hypothetical protein
MPTLNFARACCTRAARNVRRILADVMKPGVRGDHSDSRLMLQAEFAKMIGDVPWMPELDCGSIAAQMSHRIHWMIGNNFTNAPHAIY